MADPVDDERDTVRPPWVLVEFIRQRVRETGGMVSLKQSEADALQRYLQALSSARENLALAVDRAAAALETGTPIQRLLVEPLRRIISEN